MRRFLGMLLGSAVLATTGLAQSAITLRPAARIADGPVTLRQVALLEGAAAEALGDLVIVESPAALEAADGWRLLELGQVRAALEAHDAPWGALTLRGGTCAVRIGDEPAGAESAAAPGAGRLASEMPAGTVGAEVARQLAAFLAVDPAALRLRFDDADLATMDRPGAGIVIDARPTGLGERTPVALRIYRADWIELDTTIRIAMETRRPTATARRDIRRGEIIEAADVALDEAWLPPDAAPARDAIGAVARASIGAGQIVMQTDTEAPLVVRRRDRVTVDIVSGTIRMQVKMRALGDGCVGDVVEFETIEPDRRDRRRMPARVNAPGRAVALVGK